MRRNSAVKILPMADGLLQSVAVAGAALLVSWPVLVASPPRTHSTSGPGAITHRWTVDGGGGMFSTGGHFVLSGTIGQHDAGSLQGGDYKLNGGFWFPIATGDCNADGIVNLFDYSSFADCVTGPDTGPVAPTCRCSDYDGDGDVDLEDWGAFQSSFGS